ncbi:hypothetical protein RND71_033735 [Anisodus tanguticus]|uniref:Uncharacterized protein n=1 Tax=Anisodus tanguticus TaxID=243964 RepID=A0AAE1V1R9_9SOLA|nr:hypothetical protein RND71_033735 [Anisodus tanguticus]
MANISESATPFPHGKGIIFKIQYLTLWNEPDQELTTKHVDWIRSNYTVEQLGLIGLMLKKGA